MPPPLALALTLWTAAQSLLQGTVTDPQARPVEGALVEVDCGGERTSAVTPRDGRFSIPFAASNCGVVVSKTGFEPWRGSSLGSPLDVRLRLERVREQVTVLPQPDSLLSPAAIAPPAISAADLKVLGPDSRLWLELAAAAAGAMPGARTLLVDGLPAHAPPPSARIASVAVNVDPFSAEVDGLNQTTVAIDSLAPDRLWHFNVEAPTLRRGGSDPIEGAVDPEIRRYSGGLSGPVPGLPLAFHATASRYTSHEHPSHLDPGGVALLARGHTRSSITSWGAGVELRRHRLAWTLSAQDSRISTDGAGISAYDTAMSAAHSSTHTTHARSTWRVFGDRIRHRGGLTMIRDARAEDATFGGEARSARGVFNLVGRDPLADNARITQWSGRHVVESANPRRQWNAGVEVWHAQAFQHLTPNPAGRVYVDALDAIVGTRITSVARGPLSTGTDRALVFVQKTLTAGRRWFWRAGLRGDWQDGEAWLWLPRTTIMTRGRGFILALNAGWFADHWSPGFYLEAERRRGGMVDTLVTFPSESAMPLVLEREQGRRRDAVVQAVATRRMSGVDLGLDYKWTRGLDLPGMTRRRDGTRLLDRLVNDRALARHQLHLRAGVAVRGLQLTGHYEYLHSRDNTDGAFSWPARAGDIRGEWAQSTGLPAHQATMVASFALPGSVRGYATTAASSGAPFSVLAGLDPDALALFSDRGGQPRNGATAPWHEVTSFYLSRRIPLWPERKLVADAGVRIENVFNHLNPVHVGYVTGLPGLGVPLAARPGRSFTFWVTLDR